MGNGSKNGTKKADLGRIYARARFVVTGDLMRVNLYPVRRVASGRKAKSKPSRAAQVELNRRRAENLAKDIAHLNFPKGSNPVWVRLDYNTFFRELGRHPTLEEVRKMAKAYLRILRREYEKRGAEFKYMNFCHRGRKSGKVHHHFLLTGLPEGLKREDLEALWKHGYGNVVGVKYRDGSIAGLVSYSLKGADVYRSCSRNCKRPQEEPYADGSPASVYVRDGKVALKDVRYIDDNPDDLAFIRKLFPGYEVSYARKTPEPITEDGGTLLPFTGPFVEIELYRRDTKAPSAVPRWISDKERDANA